MSFILDRFKKMSESGHRDTSERYSDSRRNVETRSFSATPDKESKKDYARELNEKFDKADEMLKSISEKLDGNCGAQFDELLKSMEDLFENQKKATEEAVHKENVKVYRNVQAVVVDETAKIRETAAKNGDKVNSALVFAVLAFVVSVLHFAFSVLNYLGIF